MRWTEFYVPFIRPKVTNREVCQAKG